METDIEIGDLHIFLAVAKQLSFTHAGQEVHLSQPAISVRIRQLEATLGGETFRANGKESRTYLTQRFRCFENSRNVEVFGPISTSNIERSCLGDPVQADEKLERSPSISSFIPHPLGSTGE
jgi:hypothetical protein